MTEPRSVLGQTVREAITPAEIELVSVPLSVGYVEARCDEITAVCPVTGQPDQYVVTIGYRAAGNVIESKALKLYLWGFRNEGIMCEPLAARIAEELTDRLGVDVRVEVQQKSRGGIAITAIASGKEQGS